MKIQNIGIHHAGGLGTDNFASTINLTVESIDAGHKARWPDFPSRMKNARTGLPWYVGYNIVILKDGSYIQCRPIGAETAAQVGHNFDTVSICVVGNFMKKANGQPVDVMTPGQIASLKKLLKGILALDFAGLGLVLDPATFDMSVQRIYPHRVLQPNHTDCYGTYYADDWGRQLALLPEPNPISAPVESQKPLATQEDVTALLSYYNQIQLLWMKIQDIFAKKRFAGQIAGAWKSGNECSGNLPLESAPDFKIGIINN